MLVSFARGVDAGAVVGTGAVAVTGVAPGDPASVLVAAAAAVATVVAAPSAGFTSRRATAESACRTSELVGYSLTRRR